MQMHIIGVHFIVALSPTSGICPDRPSPEGWRMPSVSPTNHKPAMRKKHTFGAGTTIEPRRHIRGAGTAPWSVWASMACAVSYHMESLLLMSSLNNITALKTAWQPDVGRRQQFQHNTSVKLQGQHHCQPCRLPYWPSAKQWQSFRHGCKYRAQQYASLLKVKSKIRY